MNTPKVEAYLHKHIRWETDASVEKTAVAFVGDKEYRRKLQTSFWGLHRIEESRARAIAAELDEWLDSMVEYHRNLIKPVIRKALWKMIDDELRADQIRRRPTPKPTINDDNFDPLDILRTGTKEEREEILQLAEKFLP